jgi:hypothetical protein
MPDPNNTSKSNTPTVNEPSISNGLLGVQFEDSQTAQLGYTGTTSAKFGNTDFGESQYDDPSLRSEYILGAEKNYLRGERQTKLDKLGNGLINMAGKTLTTAAEGIINPFYGTIAALTNTNEKGEWDPSANAYYNNTLTQTLDNVGKGFEANFPTYETKAEATATGLDKLWSFNTISRDILGGAGTTIGAAITGKVWANGMSLLGKALGAAGSAEEAAVILAEAKQSGIALSADKLKYVSDQALKKTIKDGARQGTIAITSASGESGAEAREAEKNVLYKLTHDDFGNELNLSEGELEYAKMMSKQAGDAAFAMNLPVIMADNWITFGKALFGNKTNDFAKIIKEGTVLDEATGVYKLAEKGKYANLGYRTSKIGGTMAAEGTQEQLQFGIGKTVEDYYRKKYYNPNAADFADSMTKGLAEAYGTQEGWHSGIIGALSAGIAGPGIVLASQGTKGFKDQYITNPDDAIAAKGVESLNQYNAEVIRKKFVDNYVRSANLTEDKDEALVTNDDFNYHNANEDMIFSYVYNRMQNGKLNDLKQELNAFKDLTVEELKNNYGIEISVDNKSKVDELTSKNAVKDFIESRMEKIAAIENTYNAVTKLFPNANPEIKELLMYSAQGMENTKERRKTLGVEVSDSISQPILRELITRAVPNEEILSTFFNSTPQNFGDTYAGLTLEEQENFKTFLRNNTKVNELVKDDVIKKLDDLSKLTNREKDFVAAYNALKNPQLQNEFLQQSQTLWEKYNNIANQKQQQDFEQETQTTTPQGDEQLPPDLTGGVQGVQPAVVDPANPLAQWYSANNMDYTTPEDAIMASLQDDVQSNRLTPEQAQAVLADWQANQTKQVVPQQPSQVQTQPQPTPDQIFKDPKKPQSFLMTKTKDRDSALQKDSKVVGSFRGLKEDGTPNYALPVNGQPVALATFAEVQNKLKTLFDSNENLNDHINFLVTDSGYVLILIDDMPVSIVDKGKTFKGTQEEAKAFFEVNHLFYNNTVARSIEELNANKALLNFTANTLLNFTNVGETIQTTVETLQKQNPQIQFNLKVGDTTLDKLNPKEETDIFYDETSTQDVSTTENINKIKDGLHLTITENSYPQLPIKVRIAPHANLQQELDKVNAAKTTEEKIEAVKNFNKEVFIALKPVEGINRKIELFYDGSTNTFVLQVNQKPTGSKWSDKSVSKKTAEIALAGLSIDSILEGLNNRKVNGENARPLTQSDIKYNNYIDENNEIIMSRLSTPIGEEGLFKYDLQAQIVDNAAPVTSTVTTQPSIQQPVIQPTVTTTTTDAKAETKDEYVNRRKSEIFKQLKDKYPTLITGDTINPMMVQPKYMSNEDIELAQKVLDTKILELEYDAELDALEAQPTETTTVDTELEADFTTINNSSIFIGKVKKDLINKWNKILGTNFSTKPKSAELSLFKSAVESYLNNANPNRGSDIVFSTGLEESTGIIQQEIDAIRAILPKFISIEDIKTIAQNLKIKGIPYGAFKNKVIYLNTSKGKPGVAYHEAFHAVFRTMLTDAQIQKYLIASAKDFAKSGKNMQQEVNKLRETVADYLTKSDLELQTIVLEEHMADKFQAFAENKVGRETEPLLRQLFIKIKEFFKQLFKVGNELDMFYSNILKGAFVNATPISNVYTKSNDTVFKLLPNKFLATANGFFTAQESRKIINSFAIDVYKFKTGKYGKIEELTNKDGSLKSDEQILDYFINKRINDLETKGRDYADSFLDTNEVRANEINSGIDKELYLYNKNNINSSEVNGYEVLTSSVLEKLKIFNFKNSDEKKIDDEGGDEKLELKEKFGSQDAWLSGGHDSLSQTIKRYVAFTTKTELDPLTGELREVAIDDVTLYNGLTRILADTAEENMMAKLYYASESNPNVKAFYEQMIKDLGVTFNPEDGTISTPSNSNNYNIYRAFLSNFKKSRVSQIDVLLGKTGLTWANANQNDPAKVSLTQWENNLLVASVKDKASLSKAAELIYSESRDFIKPKKDNVVTLDNKVKLLKNEFAKLGINLTTAYIKYSILKQKSLLKTVQENPSAYLTKEQVTFLNSYDRVIPINFDIFAPKALNLPTFSIENILKTNPIDIYKKDIGLSELKTIAENNALFDESIGNFSFTNAEGERVHEIINKSYVLESISKFKNETYLKSLINGTAIGLNETETKNNYFLKNNLLVNKYQNYLKDLKLNILSGIRDTNTTSNNENKKGITFGKFDGRSYLVSALTLFNNNGNKTSAKYIFRQNEASNTAYVAELPKLDLIGDTKMDDVTINQYFTTQFLNEFERIGREKKLFDAGKGAKYEKYNTALTDRAFDFTEFQYLKDIMGEVKYQELLDAALNSTQLTDVQMAEVLGAVNTYINTSFADFLKLVDDYGLKFVNGISKEMLSNTNLKNFYINDYIMSNSMNELLDGDYALSRKDKVDISKRNKSAMASGVDYGKGNHTSAIIKDIPVYVRQNPQTKVLERVDASQVTKKGKKYFDNENNEVNKITSNDAQSYASQYHIMMGSLRMGRLDKTTKDIYKNIIQFTKKDNNGKIVRNINIGNKNQSYLSETLASLNSKKTVAFDGVNGLILKMSEFGLIRSSISYIENKDVDTFVNLTNELTDLMFNKDDFESEQYRNLTAQIARLYKPIPGMEYWHNLANNMDINGIDHVATQSASKGATLVAQDSLSTDLNLSKSKFNVANNTKRLQVETPTGKKDIVFGSQILTLITSELNDNSKVDFLIDGKEIKNLGQLRTIYNEAINNARNSEFTKAIAVIKDLKGKALTPDSTYEGMIDKSELDEIVKRSLIASGADVQQMQYFEGGYNYNMIQMLVKAEQVILAHFSKGVLNQKINGDKVSLLSGAGVTVVRDINTKKVISHHEVVKNPSKYADKSKYSTNTTLKYNEEDKDGNKYSECILSQAILTRHGLKVGDMITEKHEDILKMFGYRIPTGDKQSAMSLKVVSLLPDYYNGVGIFPDEIVYLSGADFDIDSEFIQMPAFWINSEGNPVKFGTEKTNDEKFEAYQYYNKKYDKNFKAVFNNILSKDSRYTTLLKSTDLEQDQISAIKTIVLDEAYKEASIKLGLPYTKEDFIKSGLKPTANYNNIAVDSMISILTNKSLNGITNNTTSTDVLKDVAEDLINNGFIKQTESKIKESNKSAHDINGKFDANKKNSDGKNGIGIAANKIQQFAFLMSKVGDKIIKFNDEAFKFQLADQEGGEYKEKNKENQRIANNLNLLLNAFTDNAKDPIAGRLNLKFELLGGAMELIMQGMTFENTMKLINLPIIQEYGELAKTLKYALKTDVESKFTKESIKIAAIAKLLYPEDAKKSLKTAIDKVKTAKQHIISETQPISKKEIENILLGKEFESSDANDFTSNNDVQLQALYQFIKVADQNNVMSNLNTFLKLNQGLDISFTGLHDELHQAIDTFQINNLVDAPSENLQIVDEPHINITDILKNDKNTLNNIKRALVVEKQVGQKIFIEQTKVFKNEFQKFLESLNPSFVKTGDNLAKMSREFLGFLAIRSYIKDLEKLKNDINTNEADKESIIKRLKSINLGLVFNELNSQGNKTLAQQLLALKANPATRNNYIVNYFSAKINDVELEAEDQSKYEADYIDTKSFVKESNETISLLIDSVKSLYSDNVTKLDDAGLTPRDFVDNMLGYLMVKDNMTFKNNSVAKYLPVEMFGKYSKTLENIIEALVTKSDALSVSLSELGYNFRKLYSADLNSPWGFLKFMEVENNNSSIVISDNNEEITFRTKTNTALDLAKVNSKINRKEYINEQELKELEQEKARLEEKLNKEVSIIDNKKVLDDLFKIDETKQEEGSYRDKEGKIVTYTKPAYVFPQFMTIRVGEKGESNTYELVNYSSDLDINKTNGLVPHNKTEGFAVGESAVYKLVEKTGNKGVSIFSTGNYDNAVSVFSQITKKTPAERDAENITEINEEITTQLTEAKTQLTTKEQLLLDLNKNNIKSETESNAQVVNVIPDENLEITKKSINLDPKSQMLKGIVKDLISSNKDKIDLLLTPEQRDIMNTRYKNASSVEEIKALRDDVFKMIEGKNPFKC